MTIALILIAIFVALFEIARKEIDYAGASTPEPQHFDDDEPNIH